MKKAVRIDFAVASDGTDTFTLDVEHDPYSVGSPTDREHMSRFFLDDVAAPRPTDALPTNADEIVFPALPGIGGSVDIKIASVSFSYPVVTVTLTAMVEAGRVGFPSLYLLF